MSQSAASYKHLLSPIRLGSINLRNRVGMTALTRNRARNTYPTELMKDYYIQRVRGGAGLIVSEATLITRQGTQWPHAPGIWDDQHVKGWKVITDAVHQEGGHIYAQLWHGKWPFLSFFTYCLPSKSLIFKTVGRVAHPDAPEQKLAGTPVYAPSAISARGGMFRHIPGQPGYVTPTAIEDPAMIVEQYRHAAVNAKAAGFDGVELHGANGYLIAQFLDSTANQRTDQWGGSIENRARFPLQVLKALIDVFGENVAIKVTPAGGYNDVGMPIQETLDTFRYFLTEADKLNLSYITLTRYTQSLDTKIDGEWRGVVHDVLNAYGPYIKNSKLFLNAKVTPDEGQELIASGRVDGIFIGFNWITHPDLVNRIVNGIPLNNVPDVPHLQTGMTEDDWSIGYTDYPVAT